MPARFSVPPRRPRSCGPPRRSGGTAIAGDLSAAGTGSGAVAVGIGVVESILARARLVRVPQLLATALVLAAVAFILGVR